MTQDAFNYFSAVIATVTLVVTIIGLIAVYVQIGKLTETTWSNTHSKLADQSFELLKFMADYPDTYDYFYKKKPLGDHSEDRVIVLYIAEALANFMEHLILQRDNLPEKQRNVWVNFIYTTFKTSVVVRNFVLENREWYSEDLLVMADESKIRY